MEEWEGEIDSSWGVGDRGVCGHLLENFVPERSITAIL